MDLQTRIRLYEHAPGVPLRTAIDKCEPLHHQARPFGNDNLSADGPEPWQSMTTASPGAASSLALTGSVTLQPRAPARYEPAENRMVQLAAALSTTLAQAPSASSGPTSIVAPPIAPLALRRTATTSRAAAAFSLCRRQKSREVTYRADTHGADAPVQEGGRILKILLRSLLLSTSPSRVPPASVRTLDDR